MTEVALDSWVCGSIEGT